MPLTSAEKSKRYRAKDVDAYRARKRELAKTPYQREVRKLYMRRYRGKKKVPGAKPGKRPSRPYKGRTPEYKADQRLRSIYGITLEQKKQMLADQGGVCAVCKPPDPKSKNGWHVDHCHTTGKIRGILCNGCNPRLGWYEQYSEGIVTYLEKHDGSKDSI